MSADSSPSVDSGKALTRPEKPSPDFPLYAHASGRWAKKIGGKFRYFGHWAKREDGQLIRVENDGWEAALAEYESQPAHFRIGRTSNVDPNGLTVKELVNRFLTAKQGKVDAGKIGQRMLGEYLLTCKRLAEAFGKDRLVETLTADDFTALRKKLEHYGPYRFSNEVQKVKTVFAYAYEAGWIKLAKMRYGPEFVKPSAKEIRAQRNKSGPRMFEAEECRRLIEAASVPLKAMILLGLNCGFGNHDCATLPLTALDLDGGWVSYPRPKTEVKRRCPLWPETVSALRDAIAERPKTRTEAAELVFVTSRGRPWLSGGIANPVSVVASKLLKQLEINGRQGLGFYTLRHVFETIGGDSRDQIAVNAIMGHSDGSMAAVYRERIDDDRLLAVVNHIHDWLFAEAVRDE